MYNSFARSFRVNRSGNSFSTSSITSRISGNFDLIPNKLHNSLAGSRLNTSSVYTSLNSSIPSYRVVVRSLRPLRVCSLRSIRSGTSDNKYCCRLSGSALIASPIVYPLGRCTVRHRLNEVPELIHAVYFKFLIKSFHASSKLIIRQ